MLDARTQSALLAGIVTLAMAVAMLLRRGRTRVFTLFAALNLTLFGFELGDFISSVGHSDFWMRETLLAESILPTAALSFFAEFFAEPGSRTRFAERFTLFGILAGLGVACSPLATVPYARWGLGAYALVSLTLTVSLLYARMRRAQSRTERARLYYLWVGGALTVGFALTDLFARFGYPVPPLGNVALTIYVYFLSQTLLRHRLLDLNELLGKLVVLSALALVLATIYLVNVSWVGERRGLLFFNTLVASSVILVLYEPLKAKVEEWVVAFLFHERWELVRTLTALQVRTQAVIGVREMARLVLDTVYETRRVTHASLYLLSDDGLGFFCLDHRGPAPAPLLDAATSRALLEDAQSGRQALLTENVQRRLSELDQLFPPGAATESALAASSRQESLRLAEISAAMEAMCASVTIPLVSGGQTVGFFNLLDDRVAEAFASDELTAIIAVAERAAITVENSRLYERMKERDRLAALGEMAAGLAHEIRNPLGAIKGAAQYLDPKTIPAQDAEFLTIITEEVNRLDAIVRSFLDYARPLKSTFAPTDVNDVLTRTARLLTDSQVRLFLELTPDLPLVNGDADQLKQVFLNLLQNAVQAMPSGGDLIVRTAARQQDRALLSEERRKDSVPTVEIRIADTGAGIPEEAREHIFIPFYTTKEKGTGLGLAICQRLVKNHRGTIEVRGRSGPGTEFVIRLPALVHTKVETGDEEYDKKVGT